jgi:hypothetical protein
MLSSLQAGEEPRFTVHATGILCPRACDILKERKSNPGFAHYATGQRWRPSSTPSDSSRPWGEQTGRLHQRLTCVVGFCVVASPPLLATAAGRVHRNTTAASTSS